MGNFRLQTIIEACQDWSAHDLHSQILATPFSRVEFLEIYVDCSDEVESARRLVIRSFMGFGSNSHERVSGFRANSNRSGTTPAHDWKCFERESYADGARKRTEVLWLNQASVSRSAGFGDFDLIPTPPKGEA